MKRVLQRRNRAYLSRFQSGTMYASTARSNLPRDVRPTQGGAQGPKRRSGDHRNVQFLQSLRRRSVKYICGLPSSL